MSVRDPQYSSQAIQTPLLELLGGSSNITFPRHKKYSLFSDVLETSEILNIDISNYDLNTPDKEIKAGDRSTEYFEADDEDADIIKIEDDSGEEDVASTSNSDGDTGRRRISKRLRLRSERQHVLNIFLNIEL